ncbi:MAG: DMT family transporter [Kangiellaceae bacterium]|nr:DMT family transporter [Kangiellaceae bacterium]
MTNRAIAVMKLLVTMAAAALVITYAKVALTEVPFYSFIWLQMLVASGVMLFYTLVVKKETLFVRGATKALIMVVGIGLLNYLLVRFLFIYSLNLLPVTTHAYLMNFVGIVTMLLSALILKEKPRVVQIVGAGVAILGLWIFFCDQPKDGGLVGLMSVSGAVLCLALTNILLRHLHLIKGNKYSHNQIATISITVGSIPLVAYGLVSDVPLAPISPKNWMIIFANGLVANAIVMLVFSQVMQHLKAYEASLIAMSALVFTALFAMPILGDYLNAFEVGGMVFMIVGIVIVQWNSRNNEERLN